MKLYKLIFVVVILIIASCSGNKNQQSNLEKVKLLEENRTQEVLKLVQQKCYICHSIASKSHDEIIAPPMVAVKRRYLMEYSSKEEFVEAVTAWVLDPKEENALMFGAIRNFNIMPKQSFNKEEIIKIATYIYSNKLEQPTWFQQHFDNQHSN
jgi:hypothetical protein